MVSTARHMAAATLERSVSTGHVKTKRRENPEARGNEATLQELGYRRGVRETLVGCNSRPRQCAEVDDYSRDCQRREDGRWAVWGVTGKGQLDWSSTYYCMQILKVLDWSHMHNRRCCQEGYRPEVWETHVLWCFYMAQGWYA